MIVGDSFDVVEAIRILAKEIEELKRDVEALKAASAGQPAKKLSRASSETMS